MFLVIVTIIGVFAEAYGDPNKIVNGRDTDIKEFPFIVGIYADNRTYCAGSILNETTIITAAHCVDMSNDMYIHAGTTRKTKPVLTKVKYYEMHYDAVIDKGINDVALLFLETPLKYGETIQKIEMVNENQYFPDGTIGTIVGWGAKLWGGPMTAILQSAEAPLINHDICVEMFLEELNFYVNSALCAGGLNFGNSVACRGDIGGPLVVNGKLIGLLSMVFDCAMPSIYTDLANSYIREFLKMHIIL